MSWIDWACLGAVIVGFILFVYGANAYDAVVGWTGVFIGIAAVAAFIVYHVYKELTKEQPPIQKP
jgi:hypothetical protein